MKTGIYAFKRDRRLLMNQQETLLILGYSSISIFTGYIKNRSLEGAYATKALSYST